MKYSHIVAHDLDKGIGDGSSMPWRQSKDLERFKRLTDGHALIMGRKTFDSIGKPLANRTVVVLTRNESLLLSEPVDGVIYVSSTHEAILVASAVEMANNKEHEQEVFVCGGQYIYNDTVDIIDNVYLTLIYARTGSRVRYTELSTDRWAVQQKSEVFCSDDVNDHRYMFLTLRRVSR